jgi:glycerophosphoryl diester phosphodiesterase
VFHDFTLDRLTITEGAVNQRSAEALARIAMKGTSDRIPTLRQFLDLIGGRVPLVVEVKSRFDGDMRLARRVADVAADYAGPVALKSFDPEIVAFLHPLAPDRPRGIVAMLDYSYPDYEGLSAERKHALANLLHFTESKPDFLSWRVRDLPCAAPYLCRVGMHLPVMTWTVRTPEDQARAADHADQMVFEGFVPASDGG